MASPTATSVAATVPGVITATASTWWRFVAATAAAAVTVTGVIASTSASAFASSPAASASFKYRHVLCVRLPFAVVIAFLVLNLVSLLKSKIAALAQSSPVNEDVIPAIIGFNEAKAPIIIPAKSDARLEFGHG
eukprot:CAMPEP_0172710714 /NCGR_PEP_ID=MMETSP1074-20121228/56523_1 /TAXON_ID=2916 /ORGANISM="Ceratium fusus, Strain PA161109" /LENGTH=133 /DNA_ID=CAMNT_0013534189 /DNA_START=258 /DNA_END=659 /DNA_ORIENTATION=+